MSEYLSTIANGVVAVAAAVLSAWLIDGGVQRRARHTIKDELEILRLLPKASEFRETLDGRVNRRLARYLKPVGRRWWFRPLLVSPLVAVAGVVGWGSDRRWGDDPALHDLWPSLGWTVFFVLCTVIFWGSAELWAPRRDRE